MRVLIRSRLVALRNFAETVQVELALKAGELVLLEEPAQYLGTQSGVVTHLQSFRKTQEKLQL